MSSLTEVSLASELYLDTSNNVQDNNRNIVYLCIEKEGLPEIISGFNCYKFSSLIKANMYLHENKTNFTNENKRFTMVEIYKWTPSIFHNFYLKSKLRNIYWKNDVSIVSKKDNV